MARTCLVRPPIEMKSTPVSAIGRIVSSEDVAGGLEPIGPGARLRRDRLAHVVERQIRRA
jgi:hypothetical protein